MELKCLKGKDILADTNCSRKILVFVQNIARNSWIKTVYEIGNASSGQPYLFRMPTGDNKFKFTTVLFNSTEWFKIWRRK